MALWYETLLCCLDSLLALMLHMPCFVQNEPSAVLPLSAVDQSTRLCFAAACCLVLACTYLPCLCQRSGDAGVVRERQAA